MKKVLFFACIGLFLLLVFDSSLKAVDTTIEGSAHFKCNFRSAYMAKHGYYFIEEILYKSSTKTNIFAANDADVIIKNEYDKVLGTGKTDNKGNFSVTVREDNNYKIIVKFHDQQTEKEVSSSDIKGIMIDLGYFTTEKVGQWIDAKLGVH